MTFDDRVQAVAKKVFTDRQARFLTTVILHAGVCVPRQYHFASAGSYTVRRHDSSSPGLCGSVTPRCTTAATTEHAFTTSISALSTQPSARRTAYGESP